MAAQTKKPCKNNPEYYYTGKEMTPTGLGFCPDVMVPGEVMMGRDKERWKVAMKNGRKIWVRAAETLIREPAVLIRTSDGNIEEAPVPVEEPNAMPAIEGEEVAFPAPAPPPKKRAAPKKKVVNAMAEVTVDANANADTVAPVEVAVTDAEVSVDATAAKAKPKGKAKAKTEDAANAAVAATDVKPKVKRPPTAFNLFVKAAILRIKTEQPGLNGQELMAAAAVEWKKHKEALVVAA